jgi:hypothetical protein
LGRLYVRRLLTLLLAALLTGALPAAAPAETLQEEDGSYTSGIPTQDFVYRAAPETAGRQQALNWCWAACIQMVLNFHGIAVTQEEIVARVYGDAVDRPAGPAEILYALSGWAYDSNGQVVIIQADPYNISWQTAIADLDKRRPLIVGLGSDIPGQPGHAYVLTAINYYADQYGNIYPRAVILRDPMPGRQSRTGMHAEEFEARLQFACRVYVVRQ